MTYPRNIFLGSGDSGRVADIERRLLHLERVSGLGAQRDLSEITVRTQITSTIYGLLPVFEIEVHVPDKAWVTFTGSMTFYLQKGGALSARQVWGALYETTDTTDPYYGGIQYFNRLVSSTTDLTETRHLDPATISGSTTQRKPAIYQPNPGDRRYLLDFRSSIEAAGGAVYIEPGSWFAAEVA